MWIKTLNAGKIQLTKISNLRVAPSSFGTGFNILATVTQDDGRTFTVILRRYLTKHKAKKQLKYFEKLGAEVIDIDQD